MYIYIYIFICVYISQGLRGVWRGVVLEAPGHMLLAAVLQACVNIGFPLSLLETTSARGLMLISVNPLWAAVFGD